MKEHLNTLYVTTQGSHVHLQNGTVEVIQSRKTVLRIPMHNLEAIVSFGRVSFSPFVLGRCAESGVAVTMLSHNGRFLATVEGYHSGNVLLRRAQYRLADDLRRSAAVAANMVAAKVANGRSIIARALRDHGDEAGRLETASKQLARLARTASTITDLDTVRGIEGDAARVYFSCWPILLRLRTAEEQEAFRMRGRNRHPPLDRVNSLLSFLYVLLMSECRAALATVGLDSQVGFLHRDRPGRPSLALDLMEEFRAVLADRTALALINRQQLTSSEFRILESGAVQMTESARRTVLTTWQKRKAAVVRHGFLDERVSVGLLPQLQARLLARFIRGDMDGYPALIWE
jgi:CRISPR-associated protein Cas1